MYNHTQTPAPRSGDEAPQPFWKPYLPDAVQASAARAQGGSETVPPGTLLRPQAGSGGLQIDLEYSW